MKVFGLTVLVLAVFLSKSNGAYQMATLDNGNYKVMWKYDMIKDAFYFNITVKATGWVGFGVSNMTGNMMNYDVMVGGYRMTGTNKTYYKDYLTLNRSMPYPDPEQNIMFTSAMEMDGYTNLVFHRMRDTGDAAKDVIIEPGMMYLVWAYHNTNDVNETNGMFMKHSQRGAVQHEFIDGKYTIVTVNANYRLYWKYDNTTDMFYFTVVVKATGWVAFGLSTSRGGMQDYDVMVGGVKGNTVYIGDYYTEGTTQPPKDASQDFTLTKQEERDGYTMLEFNRKRNTSDSKDIVIKAGVPMNIVWAYHDTNDVKDDSSFDQHSQRGGMPYTFNFMQGTPGVGGDGGGDGDGDGDGNGGKGSSAMYYPSIFGILTLLFLQHVIGA